MSGPVNRRTYEQLIAEDIAWCEAQPRTLERTHVIDVLRWSVDALYGKGTDAGTTPIRTTPPAAERGEVALTQDEREELQGLCDRLRDPENGHRRPVLRLCDLAARAISAPTRSGEAPTPSDQRATIATAIEAGVKALVGEPFRMRPAFARDVAATVVIATLDTVVDSVPGLLAAPAPSEDIDAQAERWARERVKRTRFIIDWEDMEDDYREAELAAMLPLVREARAESRRLRQREQDIIEACERVATVGQYRADIVGAINRIRRERDEARAEIDRLRATQAPLTEAEAQRWFDLEYNAWQRDEDDKRSVRTLAAGIIQRASRHDIPADVRGRPPKREPMSGDFDFASCQHPEHARNEADDGTTWCILCGDVLSVEPQPCGKIAPDGFPGAGNPCTLPVGHAGGHEARSADGRLLAISLPPALGDIPADVRAAETGTTGPTPDEEEPYNYDERDTSPLPRTIGEAVFGGPAPKPPVRTKGDRPAWLEGAETAWVEDIGTPDRERIADAWRRIFRVPLPDGVPHAIHDAGDTTYTLWTYGRVAVSAPDGHSILKLTPRAWATFIGYKGRKGGAS